MVKISKNERDWLVANGVPLGENGVSRTYSSCKHYYLCESTNNIKKLEKYKAEHIS